MCRNEMSGYHSLVINCCTKQPMSFQWRRRRKKKKSTQWRGRFHPFCNIHLRLVWAIVCYTEQAESHTIWFDERCGCFAFCDKRGSCLSKLLTAIWKKKKKKHTKIITMYWYYDISDWMLHIWPRYESVAAYTCCMRYDHTFKNR